MSGHPKRFEMKIRGPPITRLADVQEMYTWQMEDLLPWRVRVTSPICVTVDLQTSKDWFWAIDYLLFNWEVIEIEVIRVKKIFEVSRNSFFPSPFPIAARCSELESRLWCLLVLGLLAVHCSEREARVVVVGKFQFPSFLFSFKLGLRKSENVQIRLSAWR